VHAHARDVRGIPLLASAAADSRLESTAIEYGAEPPKTIAWDDAAAERMKKIPAFVRGMVIKAVEESCRRSGIDRVTAEELEKNPRADADAEDLR
jgi:hypothetical protein